MQQSADVRDKNANSHHFADLEHITQGLLIN